MEPLLERLNKQEYNLLLENSSQRNVQKGIPIYEEGERAGKLFFILEGEVRIYKKLGANKDLTIFLRGVNDGFGEIGIFSGHQYSNTAQAQTFCRLCEISQSVLEKILTENGRIGLHFTRWVAETLEASKAKIRDYLAFGSEGAVASVFVRYSNMYGKVTEKGIEITEPIMIQDISRHIAVSRETVSRIVNKWKDDGIIANENKNFTLRNMEYFKEVLACDKCGVKNCVL